MQPIRLLVVATAMVAVLALVAGFAATSDRIDRDRTDTETAIVRPAARVNDSLVANVPRSKPIVMHVGDTITLNVTLAQDDTLQIEAFGLDEAIAGKIPTPVIVTAVTAGRFPLKLQDSGKSIGELVVKPARPASESGGTTPDKRTPEDTAPEQPSTSEPSPA
ncbi:hypothetical protein AB0L40_02365 [Patulibacter sp. NPDC049589]|uniref:hypothetical protein n=1 Tax=Patulibacter sp. NPDC049589 TaxID=3154731 RepID=UPI003440C101